MPTINIIGAGRVGRTLLRLLGPAVHDVSSATLGSAEQAVAETGHGRAVPPKEVSPADIWLLTVPDGQIFNAAKALSALDLPPAIAIHCSGFHTADAMAPLRAKGWHLASAHPNFSFADPKTAFAQFAGTFVGVEGDPLAIEGAEALFTDIGASTFPVSTSDKALYHAAAVFSNNFTTVLQGAAQQIWKRAGVPDDVAHALGVGLLNSAADNVTKLGPADALTGPAARGDHAVVETEARALKQWSAEAGELYEDLSRLAERLKTTGEPFGR